MTINGKTESAETLLAAASETTTPPPEREVNVEDWAKWFKFQTFGDSQLEKMVLKAARFIMAVDHQDKPYWLTFTGSSGSGKTFLADKIYQWVKNKRKFQTRIDGDEIVHPLDWVYWPKAASALQRQDQEAAASAGAYDALTTQFVVLDEIGGIKDSTGYVTSQLTVILGDRQNKWTVLTSNLTLAQISERMDTRIASRLIRDRNQAVEIDTMDFAMRAKVP